MGVAPAVLAASAAIACALLYAARLRRGGGRLEAAPEVEEEAEGDMGRRRLTRRSREGAHSPVTTRGERTHSMVGADRSDNETRVERSHSIGASEPEVPERPAAPEARGAAGRRRSVSDYAIAPTTW